VYALPCPDGIFLPACIVAKGRTAKALQWFLDARTVVYHAGVKLFDKFEDGLDFLTGRLGV
jgi:hypothetical protein